MTRVRVINVMLGVFVMVVFGLSGCGGSGGTAPATGGGGSTIIAGTAADGAPIIGTVTVQDSSTPAKTKQVNILADGKYNVDVANMTGPFMLRADGTVGGSDIHLYSAATNADLGGIINVTPFTDLIIANIAGSLAKTYYDNQGFKNLSANDIKTNADGLKSKILPVLQALGVDSTVDLVRVSFSADSTGFDRVMDVIKVTTDPATQIATINNIITGQQITNDLKAKNILGNLDNVAGLDDFAQIDNQLKKFSALFATSVPQPTNPQLLALFDQQGFMHSGQDINSFLSDITSDASMVGFKITKLEIISIQNSTAQIAFIPQDKNGAIMSSDGQKEVWQAIKTNNVWLLQGNQKIADVNISNTAICYWNSQPITSSLYLSVEDKNNRIDTAKITGPGISGTITLNKSVSSSTLRLNGNAPFYDLTDSQVATIPDTGASYVFKLYLAGVLKATYTATLNKRPFKPSELSSSMFCQAPGLFSSACAKFIFQFSDQRASC